MPRLPRPGGDDGSWGSILNEYLSVSLNADGSLKSQSVIDTVLSKYTKPASGIPESDLNSLVIAKLNASSATALNDLTDVDTSSATDGQVLTYNNGSSSWSPVTLSGGGSATNLTWTASSSTLGSSTGTGAVITPVDGSNPGLMSVADKAKLDGVEAGATADQTGAQIKAAYEAEANTNAYTDADQTKLAGLNSSAQTPAGGAIGQVLKKISGTDYDYGWAADVSGGSLGPDSVTATELADNAVDTGAIVAGAVNGTKIATDAITDIKILDNTISAAKLNASVSLTDFDGTKVTGDVALNNNKIIGLAAPTLGTDAANKTYVDTVAGGGGSQSLSTLAITAGDITVDLSATQSFYVNANTNITSVTVVNGPAVGTVVEWVLIVAANGADRDITLPAGWLTPGGTKTFTVSAGQSRVIAVLETGTATRANISDDLS